MKNPSILYDQVFQQQLVNMKMDEGTQSRLKWPLLCPFIYTWKRNTKVPTNINIQATDSDKKETV